ncbi:PREDICTED: annexin A8-like [Galeopterus variegatus]|uniref:Annexin n=1 Tax=Galeopterus variegatus TaxID=482537 RepID=A0ABM0SFD6_GALVR|nr:PREDICTED: annexin A8-like [Galeopterus variegatus]
MEKTDLALLQIEQDGVTVKGNPHFNPDPDAETLYKAMKGIGTNEQAIIDELTETLKSELSGKFERLIVALMYPPYRYEARELHDAMKGLGTKEGVIIEILASRTKNQLQEIMKAYKEDYGSSLEEDIQADTSGYLERILVCLLQGSRDDVSSFVDPGLALQDAQDLYAAGEKIRGTDEMKFITILCTRSATHLMRVFEEYEKIANKSIEDSIKSETHGSLEEAMLTVVKCTRNLHSYFAERLYYAMKGSGTVYVVARAPGLPLDEEDTAFPSVSSRCWKSKVKVPLIRFPVRAATFWTHPHMTFHRRLDGQRTSESLYSYTVTSPTAQDLTSVF